MNQRSYAWKASHVRDLLTDLNGAIAKGATEYFLGSIVVVKPHGQAGFFEVHDGQQRLATTMILIAAIRDFFATSLKDDREASIITQQSLISLARRGQENAAILTPSHDAWSTYHQEVRAQLDTLRYLGVSQIRPLLLAAFGKFTANEMQRLIKNSVNWSVRCLITGVPSGNLEGVYSRTAKSISDGNLKDVDDVARELVSLVPADDRFEAAVSTTRVPTASLARYYLRKLQIVADGKDEPEYTPNEGKPITLEHILPQRPGPDWTLPPEKMQELYNRLGNQALLPGSVNSKLGNAGFDAKKKALMESKYSLTSETAREATWGEAEITKRQIALAKLAVKAWPFVS
jgi:hypothetical protein